MAVLLGIDIGTSSTKSLLLDSDTGVIGIAAQGYGVHVPQIGYAEQDPEDWWNAVRATLAQLKAGHGSAFGKIEAIGLSGQMHGLVAVDKQGRPVRPAITWLDQRSEQQVAEIMEKIPLEEIGLVAQNRPFTGFAFPSLLWIQENEPEAYRRIDKILLPKDYIRLRLTGEFGSDVSDASSTTCFDIPTRTWSRAFFERMGLDTAFFPGCRESTDIAGGISKAGAAQTGLAPGIPVVFGGGDQQCQGIGNGAYREGVVISNIGTGGEISSYVTRDLYDRRMRTHTFCHVVNKAHIIFGATLCSGMSLRWLRDNVLGKASFEDLSGLAAQAPAASEGVVFLPHLSGERTPYMNPKSKGIFFGLRLMHDQRHLTRAVMEGVVFSLKATLDIFGELGIGVDEVVASGGAATSPVWLQIQSDVFGKPIRVSDVKEQACLGAAILAALGTGVFKRVEDSSHLITFGGRVYEPAPANRHAYDEAYQLFIELYDRNKDLFER